LKHADTSEDELSFDAPLASTPITSGVDVDMDWQTTFGGTSCAPDDKLVLRWYFHSNQTDGVDLIELTYQTAERPTYVTVTWEGATSSGAGVTWDKIKPTGQSVRPFPTGSIGSGWIDLGLGASGSNFRRLTGCTLSTPLKGLTMPFVGTDETVEATLVLDGPVPIEHQAASPPAGQAAIWVPTDGRSTVRTRQLSAKDVLSIKLLWMSSLGSGGAWLLEGT
jgi:hypothetical protein